jgi:hypothetical protein
MSDCSEREITVKGWPNITGLDWSPDGKRLYCGSVSPQGSTLLYVDLKGDARVLWHYKGSGFIWGVPSPDGCYLAIGAPPPTAMSGWSKVSEYRRGHDRAHLDWKTTHASRCETA